MLTEDYYLCLHLTDENDVEYSLIFSVDCKDENIFIISI